MLLTFWDLQTDDFIVQASETIEGLHEITDLHLSEPVCISRHNAADGRPDYLKFDARLNRFHNTVSRPAYRITIHLRDTADSFIRKIIATLVLRTETNLAVMTAERSMPYPSNFLDNEHRILWSERIKDRVLDALLSLLERIHNTEHPAGSDQYLGFRRRYSPFSINIRTSKETEPSPINKIVVV